MEGGTRNVRRIVVPSMRSIRSLLIARSRSAGFTIVEVMIVLAITGLLFLSAAALISGKQNQAAFDQAIQQLQSQIQQTMNEVSVGYYPNRNDFVCVAGGTGPLLSSGSNQQGTNN